MSGTITFSGYNDIDWGSILDAMMTAESIPLNAMEEKLSDLEAKTTEFANLATKLGTLESAAEDLTDTTSYGGRTTKLSDSEAISAEASSTAALGAYDLTVTKLARAQVTTLATDGTTTIPDKDTTIVSTGGTLTFLDSEGNVLTDDDGNQIGLITLDAGSYTLDDLADAVNSVDNLPVRATIVQANGNYKLVLTGSETGAENAFTVQNNLTSSYAFTTTQAMAACDAEFTINNVAATSASNSIEDAIPGVTVTLLKETAGEATTLTVTQDTSTTRNKIKDFIAAFNDLMEYVSDQKEAYLDGESDNIGSDSLLRTLRSNLVSSISKTISGGTYCNLAEIGIEFEQDGTLSFDSTVFDDAVEENGEAVERLLSGVGSTDGVFQGIEATITRYTEAGGLVPTAKERNEDRIEDIEDQIAAFEERLALREASLLAQYSAADQTIQTLNSQGDVVSALLG